MSRPESDINAKIKEVFSGFNAGGEFLSAEKFGSGHINDSFHVKTTSGLSSGYLLQRINHKVFRNIPALMNNILEVTKYLSAKIESGKEQAVGFMTMELVPAGDGKWYYCDQEGNCWRMYYHIPGSFSYDKVENPSMAYEGGRAFGRFQQLTAGFEISKLSETIPLFHNIDMRLEAFNKVIKNDPVNRAGEVKNEIDFIRQRAGEMRIILLLGESGKIPLRVTHNDTKFNNILFDKEGKGICIVDLDTVMPGYSLYDFGDAIRTGANAAAEDEKNLERVGIDLGLFGAYTRGYLEMTQNLLNSTEKEYLAFSAKFMTYIIGLRFLTDFIDGDHYFRIRFPEHNLRRARVQFRLLESMERNFK